jgi:DNA-directed RNA polymerase sigma subunit (sigma70/sigma32)
VKFFTKFPYEYHNHLDILDDRERKAVVNYFGLAGKTKLSLEQLAELFRDPGLSTSETRALLSQAMGKLAGAHQKHIQQTTRTTTSNN